MTFHHYSIIVTLASRAEPLVTHRATKNCDLHSIPRMVLHIVIICFFIFRNIFKFLLLCHIHHEDDFCQLDYRSLCVCRGSDVWLKAETEGKSLFKLLTKLFELDIPGIPLHCHLFHLIFQNYCHTKRKNGNYNHQLSPNEASIDQPNPFLIYYLQYLTIGVITLQLEITLLKAVVLNASIYLRSPPVTFSETS